MLLLTLKIQNNFSNFSHQPHSTNLEFTYTAHFYYKFYYIKYIQNFHYVTHWSIIKYHLLKIPLNSSQHIKTYSQFLHTTDVLKFSSKLIRITKTSFLQSSLKNF